MHPSCEKVELGRYGHNRADTKGWYKREFGDLDDQANVVNKKEKKNTCVGQWQPLIVLNYFPLVDPLKLVEAMDTTGPTPRAGIKGSFVT